MVPFPILALMILSQFKYPLVKHRFCFSVGLYTVSRVRASGETLKRRFFDAFDRTVVFCLLGESFCWHSVLPDPARPLRRALRFDLPVVCPVLDSKGFLDNERIYILVSGYYKSGGCPEVASSSVDIFCSVVLDYRR